MKWQTLQKLIEEKRKKEDNIINLGSPDCRNGPSQERIEETERLLGQKLPPSYLWFLNEYGGGEIYGDEIYSIYTNYTEIGGDVADRTKKLRTDGFIKKTDILVCATDFGELFILDTSILNEENEYPVFKKMGLNRQKYADDFGEFLVKYISEE